MCRSACYARYAGALHVNYWRWFCFFDIRFPVVLVHAAGQRLCDGLYFRQIEVFESRHSQYISTSWALEGLNRINESLNA